MKTEQDKIEGRYTPPTPKAYSVAEILTAGGTTAFADKLGKKPELLAEELSRLPKEAFLTDEEYEKAIETLNQSK